MEHLLEWEDFLNEENIIFISEATKTAWNGRFTNLDKVLVDNYENMKDTDKKLKDDLFFAYYRYFNDGDVNAFPKGLLKKIGCPEKSIEILGDREIRSNIKWKNKNWRLKTPKGSDQTSYEEAMEDAIESTFKYFSTKYPEFFNAEGRKKTIDKWKDKVIKYAAKSPTELDAYWVADFGKQFGVPELDEYNPHAPENKSKGDSRFKITDKEDIKKIIGLMLDRM